MQRTAGSVDFGIAEGEPVDTDHLCRTLIEVSMRAYGFCHDSLRPLSPGSSRCAGVQTVGNTCMNTDNKFRPDYFPGSRRKLTILNFQRSLRLPAIGEEIRCPRRQISASRSTEELALVLTQPRGC